MFRHFRNSFAAANCQRRALEHAPSQRIFSQSAVFPPCLFDLENAARRWRNANSWLIDLEMQLEYGETRTRGCKNLEIKNYMYPTPPRLDFQPFCEPAFLAPHYPRPPCAPSFVKSRTLRILLYQHISYLFELPPRGILGCLSGFGLWVKTLRGH